MNVQSILSTKGSAVATIDASSTLAQATASLRDHGVGALVVSSGGGTIEGILSERDVVRALAAHGAGTLGRTISSAMSTDVVTCRAEDTVDELMAIVGTENNTDPDCDFETRPPEYGDGPPGARSMVCSRGTRAHASRYSASRSSALDAAAAALSE